MELGGGSVWKRAKALHNEKKLSGPLEDPEGLIYTSADKAEAFTVCMEEQFKPKNTVKDITQQLASTTSSIHFCS